MMSLHSCGDESLGSEPQSLHYCQGYILCGVGERNRGYALLMTVNKLETALYIQSSHFFLLLASPGGLVHGTCV